MFNKVESGGNGKLLPPLCRYNLITQCCEVKL